MRYEPAGIIHRGESIEPGPGGTIVHNYWDECQGRYIRELITRAEWDKMMEEV